MLLPKRTNADVVHFRPVRFVLNQAGEPRACSWVWDIIVGLWLVVGVAAWVGEVLQEWCMRWTLYRRHVSAPVNRFLRPYYAKFGDVYR